MIKNDPNNMLYTKLQTQCVGSCKYNDTPKNATYNKDELSSHDCIPVWWSVANVNVHRLLPQNKMTKNEP